MYSQRKTVSSVRLSDDLHPDVEAGVDLAVCLVEGDAEVVHAVTHELLDHLGQGGDGDGPLDIMQSVSAEFLNFDTDTERFVKPQLQLTFIVL